MGMYRPEPLSANDGDCAALRTFVQRNPRLLVLTGAGCSTASGIPDYRDEDGNWKHRHPVYFQDFVRKPAMRQFYWARSMLGWSQFTQAQPNAAHGALARLEQLGYIEHLVTQNVDRLHQRAGSRGVTDLHGRLDRVECLDCARSYPRAEIQGWLEDNNSWIVATEADSAPDGDARLAGESWRDFRVPHCARCGGMLKPSVVFFGESVAGALVEALKAKLARADALLVVGSSLMIYSGYRFCRFARELGKPIAAVNLGRTRADDELCLKIEAPCGGLLEALSLSLAEH